MTTATDVKAITGGINDRITRDDGLERRCRTWRSELLWSTHFWWLYKVRFFFIPRSLIRSAQSGMARRIEMRVLVGEEDGFVGLEEERTLKEIVMGLGGKVGCNFEKVLGVKLEEMEILVVGLIGFVGCAISRDY
ncbi:hypothetical protein PanWU01x14_277080 [Parasponia andersonii]|uniref:Uncharacterized protein n=1 Tax=Parasponia andersonii TaxID=3476 RepID=A0A2P5B2M8_PARAD|nr:hypothetical protein PanWU01x14_277080 [Parasponia andersonii]